MLEHYYVKPSTIDRIRVSWLGSQIENYIGDGWKRTAILPVPYFVGCHGFSALLSSQRRGAAQMLHLPLLSSKNLYPNGWLGAGRSRAKDTGLAAQACN